MKMEVFKDEVALGLFLCYTVSLGLKLVIMKRFLWCVFFKIDNQLQSISCQYLIFNKLFYNLLVWRKEPKKHNLENNKNISEELVYQTILINCLQDGKQL